MPSYYRDATESHFRAKYPFIDKPQRTEPSKRIGERKALVLLINFPDKPYTHNATKFQSMLFDRVPGSMWHYYNEVSYSKFQLDGYVYGWLRAPYL
jgi:bacillopeptidase F (M6 metalloprotease family)